VAYKGNFVPLCYKCELIKGGKDCRGNPIGTRELKIAEALASVLELSSLSNEVHHVTFSDLLPSNKQKGETVK